MWCFRWIKTFLQWIISTLPANPPSLPVRIHRSAPTTSLKLPWKPAWMPMAAALPNKELTPQMERPGVVGGSGRRGKRMVWRRKGVAGGRHKGGELRAVESGTPCSSLYYAPALLPPQHPHLRPCSLTVRPLVELECWLSPAPTPSTFLTPPSSWRIRRNKREAEFFSCCECESCLCLKETEWE